MAGNKEQVAFEITGDDKSGRAFSSAEQRLRGVEAAVADVSTKVLAMGAAVAAAEATVLASVIKTSAEFERYATQLETIEGSSAKAARSMDWITDFTAKTPFELDQVTASFVKLKAFGIDPIANDTLTTLGDTAAAMGKSLDQAVEALADAATGEFERLKEFGIKARVEGDKVSFAYTQNGQEMVAAADRTSQEMIRHTLLGIWNDKYAGGMDKLSKTWEGMVSNLSDNWTIFKKNIGDAGVFNAAKGSLGVLLDELNKNDEAVKLLAQDISDGLVSSMEVGIVATAEISKALVALGTIDDVVRLGIDKTAGAVVDGVIEMSKAWSGYVRLLQDITGIDYSERITGTEEVIASLEELQKGIQLSTEESSAALETAVIDADASIRKIEALSVKLTGAMEKASMAGASRAANDDTGDTETSGRGGAAAAAAQEEADKVISIHQAKFERMAAIAAEADMEEEERLLSRLDRQLADMEAEKERIMEMDAFKAASKEQQLAFEEQFDNARIALAQQTANKLAKVKQKETGWQLSHTMTFLNAMQGLMSTRSRAAFEIGKHASAGGILVKSAKAAWNVFESLSEKDPTGGIAAGIAAAAVAVKGVSDAAKVESMQFGGGSGAVGTFPANPHTGLPAPSAPQPPAKPVRVTDASQQPQTIIHKTIYFQGNLLTPEFVRSEVLPEIYRADEDGEVLVFSPRGRTAAEILDQAA